MRTEEYACDRCGDVADRAAGVYWYELPARTQAYDLMDMDLCPRCAAELRAWCTEKKEDR